MALGLLVLASVVGDVLGTDILAPVQSIATVVLLAGPAVVLLLVFIGVPLWMYRSNWYSATLKIDSFDPSRDVLPADVIRGIDDVNNELVPEGFQVRAHLWVQETAPNTMHYLTMWQHPRKDVTAELLTTFVGVQRGQTRLTATVIRTEGENGREYMTASTTQLRPFPAPPWRTAAWLSEIRSAAELCRIHHRLWAAHIGDVRSGAGRDPKLLLQTEQDREFKHWTESRYVRLDPNGGRYRLTLKGAFLGIWKGLWPVSAIRRWRKRRETSRLLRDAGVEL